MTKTTFLMLFFLLTHSYHSYGQNNCGIIVDTTKIFLDENLDYFVSGLQTQLFKTSTKKRLIPTSIKQMLNCLTKDNFSIANPDEEYSCCCTSTPKLPKRKLLFFSKSKEIFLITYLTGGVGVSTRILMLQLQDDKIIDIWTGYGFPEFKSIKEVIKHIKNKKKIEFALHSNLSI